jgi:drug/metabolite transporter (DMT)-like permease
MAKAGVLPLTFHKKLLFLLMMFFNPWILSGFIAAFLAALCWMAAMTKFDLSYAYPFMSLSFIFVLILSNVFFQEPITLAKVVGILFVVLGIVIGAQR